MKSSRYALSIGLLLGIALCAGCSQFDLRKNIPWGETPPGTFEKPLKMSAIWTDSILQTANKPATRGFGGRLMFYGKADEAAIKVDGSLVVYAFDEARRDPQNVAPNRKYVFTPEQFAKHYSKSDLGHSYSVWIPWDAAGGEQKEISLIARFIPKDGGAVVVSDQSKHILPGRPTTEATENMAKKAAPSQPVGEIQQAAYQTTVAESPANAAGGLSDPTRKMSTTTISVPPRFGPRAPTVSNGGSQGTSSLLDRAQSQMDRAPTGMERSQIPTERTQNAVDRSAHPAAATTGHASGVISATANRTTSSDSRPVHSPPFRHRVLGSPISRLERDRVLSPPRPSEQPPGPEPSP